MQIYRIIFSLLISVIIVNSCSPVRGLKETHKPKQTHEDRSVLNKNYKNALFKAGISIFNNYYSGLFFIKQNYDEQTANIVFMSEFGLSFMDLTFSNNDVKTNNIQEFLNRKHIIRTFENIFVILFINSSKQENTKTYTNTEQTIKVSKIKRNSSRYYYFCNQDNNIEKIIERKRSRTNLELVLKYEESDLPKEIIIESKRIDFIMNLELVRIN